MKKYFIHNGNDQLGPFSIEALKEKGITGKTMIWFEGIEKWTEAQFIPELKEIITVVPPPFEKNMPFSDTIDKMKKVADRDVVAEIENKIPNQKGKSIFRWVLVLPGLIGLICIILFSLRIIISKTSNSNSGLDSIAIIKPRGSVFYDTYDQKWQLQIEGVIMNKANVTSYKDFVISVDFLSETKTLLETKQFMIYKSVEPLEEREINTYLEGNAPNGSYSLQWKCIGSTPFIDDKKRYPPYSSNSCSLIR